MVRHRLVLSPVLFSPGMPLLIIDPAGRRMQVLKPGVNELNGLAPGIYFIVGSSREDRKQIRRLIIVR